MYKLEPITEERVVALLRERMGSLESAGMRQPEILDALRGPLEHDANGDVIPRPHEDLEAVLTSMRRAGRARFDRVRGGWTF